MGMEAQKQNREKRNEFRSFSTLVAMLLSDTLKLSFNSKSARKASIIRIVTSVLIFAVLTALGVLFYRLSSMKVRDDFVFGKVIDDDIDFL